MIRLDENMEKSLRSFIETIAQTEIYQNYAIQKERLKEEPELARQIDEYRHKNLEIQQNYHGEELLQKMEEFEMNYASLCANPLVDRYLSAELALARMYQEIQKEIHGSLGLH